MHLLVEEFLTDNLEFKLDVLETLENHREEFIDWRPNWKLMQYLIDQLIPSKSSTYKSEQATTWLVRVRVRVRVKVGVVALASYKSAGDHQGRSLT